MKLHTKRNIFLAVERAVAESLERGEMEKFTRILEAQREVKGLLEFSLYDRDGVVSHSSDPSFLKNRLSEEIKSRLTSNPEMIVRQTEDVMEFFSLKS